MGRLIDDPRLRNRTRVFLDRGHAGRRLAEKLWELQPEQPHLFAIPAGGVPVAAPIAAQLATPLHLIIVRKIRLPWTTEAGFGALDPEGHTIFNEDLLAHVRLSPEAVQTQVAKTLATLRQREERLRGSRLYPDLAGRPVVVVDDGLASGYTMRAAVRFLKEKNAGLLIVAVPTGSLATVHDFLPEVDALVCLNVRAGYAFAVAAAYENWYDLEESEVLDILASLPPELRG
jgi:predicted phosphoribosyltransferase